MERLNNQRGQPSGTVSRSDEGPSVKDPGTVKNTDELEFEGKAQRDKYSKLEEKQIVADISGFME